MTQMYLYTHPTTQINTDRHTQTTHKHRWHQWPYSVPLWLSRIWQRDRGGGTHDMTTLLEEGTIKSRGKKHFTIVPGNTMNSNSCIRHLGGFTRRVMQHQNKLLKERWSMHGWRLSSCGLAKPSWHNVVLSCWRGGGRGATSHALLCSHQGRGSPAHQLPVPHCPSWASRASWGDSQAQPGVQAGLWWWGRSKIKLGRQSAGQMGRDMAGDQHS